MGILETSSPAVRSDLEQLLTLALQRMVTAVRERHTWLCEGIGESTATIIEQTKSIMDVWQLCTGKECDPDTIDTITEYPIPVGKAAPCPTE